MKKILWIVAVGVLSINGYSSQMLNNKIHNIFPNREVKSLIFGNYNLDTELAVISKMKGTSQDIIEKTNADAKKGLETAIRSYSYSLLSENLSGILVSGPGFDRTKMREFSSEISKNLIVNGIKKGVWSTSKNETVVLYTIDKQQVKFETNKLFNDRLDAVIRKLNEYKDTFDSINR